MIFTSSFYATITGTLLLLVLGQEIEAGGGFKVTIDNRPLEDGSSLTQLCDSSLGKDMRISRISSITKLHGYFNSLDNNDDLKCRNSYLEPLNELKALLDLASENICSFEVMKRINNFHWRYIVGGLSSEWRKASNESSPEPLKMFFMNYAQEVTEFCRNTLERRLEQAASGNNDLVAQSLYSEKFSPIINRLSNILHPQSKIKKHGDFLLLWDQLIDRERMKGRSVEQKLDRATGEMVILSLKVKQPEKVWLIQKKCREELQPIYKETVFPVMKLISIGYGGKEERSRDDVAGSELVKNWYAITQFCQLVLPVNFYLDKGIKNEQVTVLSPEESANLAAPQDSLAEREPQSLENIMESVRLPDVLPNSNRVDKQVKSNLKARSHIYRRVMRNAIKMTNGQLKSRLKDLFISKKVGDNKYVVENGESTLKKQLSVQERELLVEEEDDDDDVLAKSKSRRFLFRSKRGVLYFIFSVFVIVCLVTVVTFFMYMLIVSLAGAAG